MDHLLDNKLGNKRIRIHNYRYRLHEFHNLYQCNNSCEIKKKIQITTRISILEFIFVPIHERFQTYASAEIARQATATKIVTILVEYILVESTTRINNVR